MMIKLLSNHKRGISLLLFWFLGVQTVIPAFASGPSAFVIHSYANPSSQDLTFLRKSDLPFIARPKPRELKDSNVSFVKTLPSKPEEPLLQSDGPGQPEMSSFKSVESNNLVDPFSGDLSYNIPLLDVGGYPVNIYYSSGITMDQEASWVGLGWNINPGTIGRNMRGLPDDFNGSDSIEKTVHTKPNISVGVNAGLGFELLGFGVVSPSTAITYDNYRGFGIDNSISLKSPLNGSSRSGGTLTGSLSISNSSSSGITTGVNFSQSMDMVEKRVVTGTTTFGIGLNYGTRTGLNSLTLNVDGNNNKSSKGGYFEIPASMRFNRPTFTPGADIPYTSLNFSFSAKTGISVMTAYPNLTLGASVNSQFILPKDVTRFFPAYGYLHYTKAAGNKKAMLDFNRENDGSYVDKVTPALAIPQYTFDVYTISAEGTGGSFRPYRSDVGYMYSPKVINGSGSLNIGLDLGVGHFGGNIKPVVSETITQVWNQNNKLKYRVDFQEQDSVFENVVFRNPTEMPLQQEAFLNAVGHDTLIRPVLEGEGVNATLGAAFAEMPNASNVTNVINLKKSVVKEKREKRNQVISYLTADDARQFGLDTNIISYSPDYLPYASCDSSKLEIIKRVDGDLHKAHHLSEVTVLNEDGRRYVYGIPAYTISQTNMTFAVNRNQDSQDFAAGVTAYTSKEITPENSSGIDGYFSSEKIPGYAHSFLLSGILSPDYVDITNDGITEDDLGDAVKFDYTRVYSKNNSYEWRSPAMPHKASLVEGLRTYSRDDKANIVRGSKEVWYLHSIVSKNLVAVFHTSSEREDATSLSGIDGVSNNSKKLMRLTRIDLYSKADLVASTTEGIVPKPIKSVHFSYDYSLCPGANAANPSATGKLTLKKIWFTYNGNDLKQNNAYEFTYGGQNNPYQLLATDVWGNYKSPAGNPGGLKNNDYPYVIQPSYGGSNSVRQTADLNASAWCLTDIKLPSKGNIKVTYEADDYSYVQDQRTMQLFTIAGIGKTKDSKPAQRFYEKADPEFKNNGPLYVFIDVPDPVYTDADVKSKYLAGVKNLYMKFLTEIPGDRWGSGSEFIPMVCDIESCGYLSSNNNRIWIKVKKIDGKNPFVYYALQYLKDYLPSKAYPGSETGPDPDLKGIVNMLGSQIPNVIEAIHGFENIARSKGWCQTFSPGESFIKLNCPTLTKIGGGLRVKRVEMFDNFSTMTNGMRDAVYGQDYSYKTKATIIENGVPKSIDVSSGVATFEPFVGGEENPIKGYYAYQQQLNKLGPVAFKFLDTPFCQSLYPGAAVGYSKVNIQTINKQYRSANGKEVYEFYTYKDFPTKWSFTPLDENSRKRHNPALGNLLKINAKHYLTLSQGFKIQLNDMHGKMKSHAFYSEADPDNYLAYTEYIYKTKTQPGEKLSLDNKVWAVDGPDMVINKHASMGQNVEIMTDFREQSSFTASPNIELNVDLIILGFITIPGPGFYMWPQWERTQFRSATVLKVVNDYGILDSVYAIDKGSTVSTKNLVFDSETGNVLLSRTNNEYRDPVYNLNYPAHWAYSGMGMAYKNIQARFKGGFDIVKGQLFKNGQLYPSYLHFESGDECAVRSAFQQTGSAGDADCGSIFYQQADSSVQKIWAYNAKKRMPIVNTITPSTGNNYPIENASDLTEGETPFIFFIDKNGKPVNVKDADITVLRSGHRNQLTASVGSLSMLQNPIVTNSGNTRIRINDSCEVVNASANTFRDCWKVDSLLYAKDTTITVVKSDSLDVTADVTLMRFSFKGWSGYNSIMESQNVSPVYAEAGKDYRDCGAAESKHYFTRSILTFNTNSVPSNANIQNATLKLSPIPPKNLWPLDQVINPNNSNDTCRNYRWDTVAQWQRGNHLALLQRVSENFSYMTKYDELQIDTSHTIGLTGLSGDFSPKLFNCKDLVQDMINDSTVTRSLAITAWQNDRTYISFTGVDTTIFDHDSSGNATNPYPGLPQSKSVQFDAPRLNFHYSYSTDSTYTICKPRVTDTTNPYRWGIYGNWRPDRAFVYYDERKAAGSSGDPALRTDGTLKEFAGFWQLPNEVNSIVPTSDTIKWVWNVASRLVNSKGAEIENVDALRRYSSAHYGYHDNLPVATVQNAQYRQAAFDGFEDYRYKDKFCDTLCPNPRFLNLTAGGGQLSMDASHTGLYSLEITPGQGYSMPLPIYDAVQDTSFPCPSCGIKDTITKNEIIEVVVQGKGNGLIQTVEYDGAGVQCPPASSLSAVDYNQANYSCNNTPPSAVEWNGYIQVKYSGTYNFSLWQAGTPVTGTVMNVGGVNGAVGATSVTVSNMVQGNLYPIHIECVPGSNTEIKLQWQSYSSPGQALGLVPADFLYETIGEASGSVTNQVRKTCYTLSRPQADVEKYLTIPHFTLLKSSDQSKASVDERFLVTAWIKEKQTCTGTSYTDAKLELQFNTGGAPIPFITTGIIIEGWQRVEAVVSSIPAGASSIALTMKSTNTIFYVDDIRIQPYSSMMKSMVYNPLNLRLMAELDENNYATFYEYDDEGTLVRVKKETERGIKTIKESRSALYKD